VLTQRELHGRAQFLPGLTKKEAAATLHPAVALTDERGLHGAALYQALDKI